MNVVSFENLLALQQLGSGSYSTSSSSSSGVFAALLTQQLSGLDITDTTGTSDLNKNIMLLMCMSMMGGTPAAASLYSVYSDMLNIVPDTNVSTGKAIVDSALSRLGDPYSKTYRGQGNYVDCSYLARWAYKQQGISIPGTAAAQAKYCSESGYTISKDELQPGDLIFWENKAMGGNRWHDIRHVAIYAGNGKIVEAKTSSGGVVLDNLWEGGNWKIVMYARPYANSNSSASR